MRDELVTMTKPAMESMKFDIWKQGIETAAEHVAEFSKMLSLAASIRAIKPPAEFIKAEPDNPYYWMWKEHQAHAKDADKKLLAAARRALEIFKCISSKSLIVDELTAAIEEHAKL